MKNKKYRSIFSYILLFISNYFLKVDEITGVILVFLLEGLGLGLFAASQSFLLALYLVQLGL